MYSVPSGAGGGGGGGAGGGAGGGVGVGVGVGVAPDGLHFTRPALPLHQVRFSAHHWSKHIPHAENDAAVEVPVVPPQYVSEHASR